MTPLKTCVVCQKCYATYDYDRCEGVPNHCNHIQDCQNLATMYYISLVGGKTSETLEIVRCEKLEEGSYQLQNRQHTKN